MNNKRENEKIVFCFDRDRTVDTSFQGPVPLEWVKKLAHETSHPVYAIGNQTLKREANIPGIEEMRAELDLDQSNTSERRHVLMPARRERVRLAEQIHPNATEHIVVDDVDLSDMDGWTHYFPSDFVTSYKGRTIDGIQLD